MEKYEQLLNDKIVMVVDFDEMPELPIVGNNHHAKHVYNRFIRKMGAPWVPVRMDKSDHYAEALTLAIENGIVPGPGKYAIWLSDDMSRYEIYGITE